MNSGNINTNIKPSEENEKALITGGIIGIILGIIIAVGIIIIMSYATRSAESLSASIFNGMVINGILGIIVWVSSLFFRFSTLGYLLDGVYQGLFGIAAIEFAALLFLNAPIIFMLLFGGN